VNPAATESEPQASLARRDGHAVPWRSAAPSPPWSFGSFVLDPARRELRRDGDRLHVEPKVLDLLAYLLRHRERVVSRDEILDALWHDEHVSDAALGYCVKEARRAIGDSGDAQHTIATVPRRGFRFVADVAGGPEPRVAAPDRARSESSFVGRGAVLAELLQALEASRTGELRVALVAGEPGIGKTRLADELSVIARQRGITVLTGRCHEDVGTPPFWPWAQILRSLPDPAPEVRSTRELTTTAPSSDERFGHFDATRSVLQRAAAAQPLLVVLDDLQWADATSLLLLRFLARELSDVALMVVAIYRDTDVGADHPMLACAADLVRAGAARVQLRGLSARDLASFLTAASAAATPEALARIHARTGGNPFFATEAIRLLVASGGVESGSARIPETVRDVVVRRIARLSHPAQALLRVASVLGREFDLLAVSRMHEPTLRERSDLLGGFDEVLAARLVERNGDDDRYRFAHDLVRESIYAALPSDLRATLHERAGEVLEVACDGDPGDRLAALAHHFDRAAVGGDPSRAIAYAVRAAERAASLFAYEEAALHYERALELGERRPVPSSESPEGRADTATLLLELGENRSRSGDPTRARTAFRRAIALARTRQDAALLGRAALGFGGQFRGVDVLTVDPELVALLEEALALLPSRASVLRGQLMARLAIALHDVPGSLERRIELSSAAVATAEATRDRAALAAALYTRHWAIWGPDTLDDRIAAATAMQQLAQQTGDRECALHAHRFLAVDALERGARAEMDRHLEACRTLGDALRQPYYRWSGAQLLAMRALLAGRIDDSERLLEEAHALGIRSGSRNVELGYQALRFWVRREQGRADELEPLLRAFVERMPSAASFRCALTLLHVEQERPDEARRHLDVLAADGFATIPRNAFWLASMIMLADVCAGLRDVARAATVHLHLKPYAGRIGELAVGGGCLGSVDRALGRLAALLDDRDGAELYFRAALRIERALDAPLLVARTERDSATARKKDARSRKRAAR